VHLIERVCDSCVLAGGAPDRSETHASDVVDAALRIMAWLRNWDTSSMLGGDDARIGCRIGIHSGPVTAGVLGGLPKMLLMGGGD
jgi:adenylate cyclase